MSQRIFKIELLGGPADGLRATAKKVPGRTIRVPACPASYQGEGSDIHRSRGIHLAVYELLWSKYGTEPGGIAVVHMSYDFVGTRAIRDRRETKPFAARLLGAIVPARPRWARRWCMWLAVWIAAPMDEPATMAKKRSVARRRPMKKS